MTRSYTVTFSGGVQNLLLACGLSKPNDDVGVRQVLFQADGGNGAACYIGGENQGTTLSSSLYGWYLDKGTGGVPPVGVTVGPFAGEGPAKLSGFYILGTAAQKLHVIVMEY